MCLRTNQPIPRATTRAEADKSHAAEAALVDDISVYNMLKELAFSNCAFFFHPVEDIKTKILKSNEGFVFR